MVVDDRVAALAAALASEDPRRAFIAFDRMVLRALFAEAASTNEAFGGFVQSLDEALRQLGAEAAASDSLIEMICEARRVISIVRLPDGGNVSGPAEEYEARLERTVYLTLTLAGFGFHGPIPFEAIVAASKAQFELNDAIHAAKQQILGMLRYFMAHSGRITPNLSAEAQIRLRYCLKSLDGQEPHSEAADAAAFQLYSLLWMELQGAGYQPETIIAQLRVYQK